MVPNYIRMRPMDPEKPSHGAINAAHIVGYKPFGATKSMTEILLINGDGFISNETVSEFEARLTTAIKPFYVE